MSMSATKMLATFTLFLSSAAWACPSCTGREVGGETRLWLIGAAVLFPLLVGWGAIALVVRTLKADGAVTQKEER